MENRKYYLDNIRWMTVLLVVVYHIFYYYNNIGADAMFKGLNVSEGYTLTGIFQYSIYQWFMLILFMVSGASTKYAIDIKGDKAFFKERINKLLVPSTLGIIFIHWIGGYLISLNYLDSSSAEIPAFVSVIIIILSGTGALWFLQVLFVNCLILKLIRKIDKNNKLFILGDKANLIGIILNVVVFIGTANILNMPMIPTYRFGIYGVAFLFGYYVLSNDIVIEMLEKWCFLFLLIGVIFGYLYIIKFYGVSYSDYVVSNNYISVIHAYFTSLGIIGLFKKYLNFGNDITSYLNKASWGIYICHIDVMLLVNTLLKPYVTILGMPLVYLIELIAGLCISYLLWVIFKNTPVIRWLLFGINKRETKNV